MSETATKELATDLAAAAALISEAFSDGVSVEKTTHRERPALLITRAAEYQQPEYTGEGGLLGMLTLFQTACGGNRVDEIGEISQAGCETCDYGSLYGTTYVVWNE